MTMYNNYFFFVNFENTFDKKKMLSQEGSPFMKRTAMKIRDFIKEKELREFFASA